MEYVLSEVCIGNNPYYHNLFQMESWHDWHFTKVISGLMVQYL